MGLWVVSPLDIPNTSVSLIFFVYHHCIPVFQPQLANLGDQKSRVATAPFFMFIAIQCLHYYTCPYMSIRKHRNCFLTGSEGTLESMVMGDLGMPCNTRFIFKFANCHSKWNGPVINGTIQNGLNLFDNQWIAITRYNEHVSVCLGPEDQVLVTYAILTSICKMPPVSHDLKIF